MNYLPRGTLKEGDRLFDLLFGKKRKINYYVVLQYLFSKNSFGCCLNENEVIEGKDLDGVTDGNKKLNTVKLGWVGCVCLCTCSK